MTLLGHHKFPACSYRSSHWKCFIRKGVLRNFAKFTGKHLSQSVFFNKVARLRPASCTPQACNFIKKETLAQVFSCEICEISKNIFFTEQLWVAASVPSTFQNLAYAFILIFKLQFTMWKVSKYGVFCWSVFSHIQSEYGKIRIRKNSVFEHFSRSDFLNKNFNFS